MNKKIVDVSLRVLVSSTLVLGLVPVPALAEALEEGAIVAGDSADIPDNDVDASGEGDAEEVDLNYCHFVNTDLFDVFGVGGSVASYVEVCGYGEVIEAKNYDLVFTDKDGNELESEPAEPGEYRVYAKAKVSASQTDSISYTIVDPRNISSFGFWASDVLVGETPEIQGSLNYWDIENNEAVYARLDSDDFEVVSYTKDGAETTGLPAEAGSYTVKLAGKGGYSGENTVSVTFGAVTELAGIDIVSNVLGKLQFKVTDAAGDEVDSSEYTLYFQAIGEDDWTTESPTKEGYYIVSARANDGSKYSGSVDYGFNVVDGKALHLIYFKDWSTFSCGSSVASRIEVRDYDGNDVDSSNYELVFADEDGDELASEPTDPGKYRVCAKAKDGSGYSGETGSLYYDLVDPTDIANYELYSSDALAGKAPVITSGSLLQYWDLQKNESVYKKLSANDFAIVSYAKADGGSQTTTEPPTEAGTYNVKIEGANGFTGSKTLTVSYYAVSDFSYATLSVESNDLNNLEFKVTDGAGNVVDPSKYTIYYATSYDGERSAEQPTTTGDYFMWVEAKADSGYSGMIGCVGSRLVDFDDFDSYYLYTSGKVVAGTTPVIANSNRYGSERLVEGQDYVIDHYEDEEGNNLGSSVPTEPGTYRAVLVPVKGSDRHGTAWAAFVSYAANDLALCTWVNVGSSVPFADGAVKLGGSLVAQDGTVLKEGVDYTLDEWRDSYGRPITEVTEPGDYYNYAAKAIEGSGWTGGSWKTIYVYALNDLSESRMTTVADSAIVGDLSTVKVTYNGVALVYGKDYEIEGVYSDYDGTEPLEGGVPTSEGSYYVKVRGIGDYKGTTTTCCVYFYSAENICGYQLSIDNGYVAKSQKDSLSFTLLDRDGNDSGLKLGKDYVLEYTDTGLTWSTEMPVGAEWLLIRAKAKDDGGFTGASQCCGVYFVEDVSLKGAEVSFGDGVTYKDGRYYVDFGTELKPVLTLGGKQLVEDQDYEVTKTGSDRPGSVEYTFTGKGSYADSTSAYGYLTLSLNSSTVSVSDIANVEYTGKEQKPSVTVKAGDLELKAGEDYYLVYENNVNAGTATVTIKGMSNYVTGEVKKTFQIVGSGQQAKSISGATVTAGDQTYTGSTLTPDVKVVLGGVELVKSTDYEVTYKDNVDAGTATVTVTGKGNYVDTTTGKFTIKAADASEATVTAAEQTWTGEPLTPAVTVTLDGRTLTKDKDYTVKYENNTNAGTATATVAFKGNYTGTAKGTFAIKAADISAASISVARQTYTGSALTPAVTVKLGNKTLANGTDYTVKYENNTNAGTAKVAVNGKGNYTGSKTTTFAIDAADASKAQVKVANQAWTGSALTPAPTVTFGGKTLKQGTDYTVAYSNNLNAGTATVTVTFKGNYAGTAKGTFKIEKKEAVGRVTMTRLYNRWSGEHLYTSNASEVKDLTGRGWRNEGTAWIAPSKSSTPVYRLYNPYSGDHHYTTSKKEYDDCGKAGWNKEGIAWYSDDAKGVPLYRGFNRFATVGTHHYTTSKQEMGTMVENGWKAEGVAWYGLK